MPTFSGTPVSNPAGGYTLFDVLARTARYLEALQEGLSNALGTTLTLVDTRLDYYGWDTDDFRGGTLFLFSGADAKKTRICSAYAVGGTITVDEAASGAIASGVSYGIMSKRYPRGLLVSKINQALTDLGDVPIEDTSLTTLSNTKEYALPSSDLAHDLRQGWLARSTVAPWDWEPYLNVRLGWGNDPAAPPSLIFGAQPPVGYKIKVVAAVPYQSVSNGVTGPITADSTTIKDMWLGLDGLALQAAAACARFRLDGPGSDAQKQTAMLNDLVARAERAMKRHPKQMPQKFPIFGDVGRREV